MMVSKVAVIALVAIFSVPILLGYGLNLSEQSVTDYKTDGDSVNVTDLLQTGTAYTSANADVYKLNTDFDTSTNIKMLPIYESSTTAKTSFKMDQRVYTIAPGSDSHFPWSLALSDIYVEVGDNFTAREYAGGTTYRTINNFKAMHYHLEDNVVEYWFGSSTSFFTPQSGATISFTNSGTSNANVYVSGVFNYTGFGNYVDFAGGFHIDYDQRFSFINVPEYTKSVLFTVDLDSITASSYDFNYKIGDVSISLQKTTTGGVVNWSTTQTTTLETYSTDLYYNQSGGNVYQFLVDFEILRSFEMGGYTYHEKNWHVESRYVGSWPTLIGYANYYMKYETDLFYNISNEYYDKIYVTGVSAAEQRTPTMRLDAAEFRAFAYKIIEDKTYNPADFKTNPTTTISNLSKAGSSIIFGGQTFNVDKSGNITLGVHKVSTNGLKLESVPVASGYENKINGNVISVTAQPSTIKFVGQWGASVSTVGNVVSSYTHTEWTPGQFAWDGIDQNFLMIGLLAAIGVFIALGIVYRKTKSALGALLVVCGGAIVLFFTML